MTQGGRPPILLAHVDGALANDTDAMACGGHDEPLQPCQALELVDATRIGSPLGTPSQFGSRLR